MTAPSNLMTAVRRADGSMAIDKLAKILCVSEEELAASTGLCLEDLAEPFQQTPSETQHRIAALVWILERIASWTSHPRIAYAWYRSQPLPSYGGMTAEDLFKMGRILQIQEYLERIADGGYA